MARHSRRVVYPDTPEDPLDILTHRYSDEYHSTRYPNPSLTPIGVLVTDFNIIVDFSRVTVYYKF